MKHEQNGVVPIRVLLALAFGAVVESGCTIAPHMHGHDHSRMMRSADAATAPPQAAASPPQVAVSPTEAAVSPPQAETPPPQAETRRGEATLVPPVGNSLADYRLGAEDLLQITLFNVPESEKGVTPRVMEERVSQQGRITLPLLGDIEVAGLTITTLERELEKRYDKYLYNAQVGVLVKEYRSQKISVIGQVQKPGVYELPGPRTVLDLLAMAGGVNTLSAGTSVRLYRHGSQGLQSYGLDLAAMHEGAESPYLALTQDRDVIDVPEARRFFVDGAVKKPGPYFLNHSYTLTEALATAGGLDTLAAPSGVTILRRRHSGEVEPIRADVNKILALRAADPQIEPDDMIAVPTSMAKFILDRVFGRFGIALGLTPFLI